MNVHLSTNGATSLLTPLTWLTRLGVEPRGAPNGATDTSQWLQLPTLGTA